MEIQMPRKAVSTPIILPLNLLNNSKRKKRRNNCPQKRFVMLSTHMLLSNMSSRQLLVKTKKLSLSIAQFALTS
jgi:hypothetical protein